MKGIELQLELREETSMRRWAIVLSTLVIAAVLGWSLGRLGSPTASGQSGRKGASTRVSSLRTSARPHPHGPEMDEVTSVPAEASWSASGTPVWTGAGRHPMWRGCQHRFDPALTTFIFGSAPPSG
jgi:hypothetical protein